MSGKWSGIPRLYTNADPSAADTSAQETTKFEARHRSPWLAIVSLVVAAILLYLTLRGMDWPAFWGTLRNGHYVFLLITVPIVSFNYFIRAFRWSIFVRSQGKVPVTSVFWANMVGYMGNSYLPARAGELLRSAFLGQITGLGTSFVLATALTERLLDSIALILIGSAAVLRQTELSALLGNSVWVLALAGTVGLIVVVVAPLQEKRILRGATLLPLPEKISQALRQQITRFILGMRALHNRQRLASFAVLTLLIWFMDAIANTIGVRTISQTLSISQGLVLLAALGLASAIPSTPGYVGVYQFVAVAVLVPFGFSRADALAYILISQILNYLVVTFWGLIGLWRIGGRRLHG